jgi:CubicO group peptidase (beta-lactamase class C family)
MEQFALLGAPVSEPARWWSGSGMPVRDRRSKLSHYRPMASARAAIRSSFLSKEKLVMNIQRQMHATLKRPSGTVFQAVVFVALLSSSLSARAASSAWDWPLATPESQGMSSMRLDAIKERLTAKKTRAFLVIRNDHIVYEWYAPGVTATTKQGTASLAKALVGGMSLAVAITDGRISIDDPAAKFIPQWKDDPRKSKITIRYLGSHTSGLSDSTTENVKHEEQPGWMGDFWKRLDPPRDPFTIARDETPILFAPSERIQYSNPGIGLMTYCVTAAIRDGMHKDVRTLLRERVMRPVGVADSDWSVGYGKTFTVEGLPLVATWGGGSFTPRATARIGRLVLREGEWDERRILSKEAVLQVTGDAGLPGDCGMGWWSNGGERYKLPKDAVWGAGAGDQLLLVVPSLNLIMVRNGETLAPGPGEPPVRTNDVFTLYHDYRARILFEPLVEAVTNLSRSSRRKEAQIEKPEIDQSLLTSAATNAVPRSSLIKEIRWALTNTIRRAAAGSDNWPLTWADDGALYGTYGDGNGFEPFDEQKLSLGLARIDGTPEDFRGQNLRALSLRTTGDGAKGRKGSGILCLKGVLNLWMRNVGNSQLAWSSDHGATWSCAAWRFTNNFGCPTFVNFGRDYAGNRDGFAYVLSPDANDAYTVADRFVLARVPVDRIRERNAYEFFAGLTTAHSPIWKTDLNANSGVLENPASCYRPSVTFNAALNRFLLVHAKPNDRSRDAAGKIDVRFNGGLAVYEAPQPWGPWSVVFETNDWDVGPGDSASFPSKWISDDGLTMHLVFSGNDSFSVRRAQFILAPP